MLVFGQNQLRAGPVQLQLKLKGVNMHQDHAGVGSAINTEHLRLLENIIKRDRNHPSVILWSDGNEEWGMENATEGRRVAEAMREYTRLLRPYTPFDDG